MSQVPVRPPRFLGEKVPYREQTVQEKIQESLGPGYTVERSDGGYHATAQPVRYLQKKDKRTKMIRRGEDMKYSSYVPHEIYIDSQGNVQKEIKRGTYTIDGSGKIKEWGVYDKEITDYEKQTRFTYGTRDLKSGRETIKKTSEYIGGKYREYRIVDQDTAEYERLKRTPEQAKLIREKGFTIRNTEEYAVAGMTKEQREQYYRLKAKQRTAQFSLEAKAQKIARQETEKFRQELSAESQKYAMDIVTKQREARQKPYTVFVQTSKAPESQGPSFAVTPPTPASPTTRTDLGDQPFLIGGKLPPGEVTIVDRKASQFALEKSKKGGIPGLFYATAYVGMEHERIQDTLSLESSRARAGGRPLSGYGYSAGEFAFSVPVGGYKMIKGVVTQPQEVIGNLVNPEAWRQAGVQLRERPVKFAGEMTGAVLVSYGIGKGIQAIRTEMAKPKVSGESPGGKIGIKRTEFQSRFPKEGKGVDIVTTKQLKYLKTKTGKGQIESTVFSSKKVIDKQGRTIETPAITKIREEIAGKPSNIGTIYGEQVGKPIKVESSIQTELIKPQVLARSKWLPGDVRPVVVIRGKPYIPDWTGGHLRPYRPGEFSLETVYPGGGLAPSQKALVGQQTLKYSVNTPYGAFEYRPSSGVQKTLIPKEIVIVKKTPPASAPAIKTLDSSIKTPSGPKVVESGGGSQVVTAVKPQKFATAGEVLHGSIKVYPKYQVTQAKVTPQTKLPETMDLTPKSAKAGPVALAGVSQFPKQEPISGLQQPPRSIPESVSIPKVESSIRSEPIVDVIPENLSASKSEAKAEAISVVEPLVILEPEIRTETRTETRLETELIPELKLVPETTLTPVTTTGIGGPPPPPPVEPPPEIVLFEPPKKEPKRKQGLYNVEVRERGIFKKVKVTQTPEEAFKFGEAIVRKTARASLRVTPVAGGKPVSDVGRSILPKKIFRESKREPGVFIERRKFRIDQPGEKKEITFKGLQALKIKSIFKR